MTSVVELMKAREDVISMLENQNYEQTLSDVIIKEIVKICVEHQVRFVYADSEGKFENAALQNALNAKRTGTKVIEVVFSKEKPMMIGNLRSRFEKHQFKMQKKFKTAYWQFKRYRYIEGTNVPKKKDDHIPDATMCALQRWPLGKTKSRLSDAGTIKDSDDDRPIFGGILDTQF
jgi:hypothetical protein